MKGSLRRGYMKLTKLLQHQVAIVELGSTNYFKAEEIQTVHISAASTYFVNNGRPRGEKEPDSCPRSSADVSVDRIAIT